jgi:C1A family cysteine protease
MPTTPNGHALGRLADLADIRDHPLMIAAPASLPSSADLRPQMPPVGDQGQIGSCTAWASTAAFRYELARQKLADFEPSELAQYYWTRSLEGTTKSDAGATIRDAVKTLATVGACPENLWPYDTAKFAKAPPAAAKKAAKKNLVVEYQAVPQTADAIRGALAAGYAVVIGISVYASFESDAVAHTGMVPMPGKHEQMLGGHALCLAGYDDATARFTTRNSWGTSFGDKGYVYLPYDYVLSPKLGSDYWVVKVVKEG